MDVCDIRLLKLERELRQPGRGLEQDRQHPGREGVERAGVADPVGARQPAQLTDHRE